MRIAQRIGFCLMGLLIGAAQAVEPVDTGQAQLERGRYLVRVADCNGCHTVGFAESGGSIPETDWLAGNPIGFRGPWGTTYPANLRLVAQQMSEAQWLARARGPMRPPMPQPALNAMTDRDLRAIYRYIRSLGPKGEPAPAYAPPGVAVSTPYIDFVPKNLPAHARAK